MNPLDSECKACPIEYAFCEKGILFLRPGFPNKNN